MRRTVFSSALTALLLSFTAPGGLAAQSFEGVITANYYGDPDKPPFEVKNMIKGTHARQEFGMAGNQMYTIADLQDQNVKMVMPDQKTYMTMSMKADETDDAAETEPADTSEGTGAGKPPSLTKTGESETIAGHTCDHYLVGKKQNVDVCAAKGLGLVGMGNAPSGMGGGMRGRGRSREWEELGPLARQGFYPLKIESLEDGERKKIMEVTKIEPQPLSDDLFVIPDDYEEMTMPKMPGM
jgi:hypothetical protein